MRALRLTGGMRRRLQDLGLVAGTRVTCIQRAAAGDPDRLSDPRRGHRAAQADAARIEMGGLP